MRTSILGVVVALGIVLSGCTGPNAPPPAPPQGPELGQDTGAVEGIVRDDEMQPIAGADVAIRGLPAFTKTDDRGRFWFSHLAPGRYVVFASVIGYQSQVKAFDVIVGEIADVSFALEPLGATEPYSLQERRGGYIACGSGVGAGGAGFTQVECGASDPAQVFVFNYTLAKHVSGVTFEMAWKPTQALSRDLLLIVEKEGCGFSCGQKDTFKQIQGCCYVRVDLTADDLALPAGERPAVAIKEKGGQIQTRTFPAFTEGTSPATVYNGQPFTIYVEYFFNGLPDDFGTRTNVPPA